MHWSKRANFERETGKSFPATRPATEAERLRIRLGIWNAVSAPPGASEVDVAKALLKNSRSIPGFNAEDRSFDLRNALRAIQEGFPDRVFLHWNSLQDIDEMSFADFADHFDSIWYPSSDDLFVYDQDLAWLLMILHYGELRFLRLSEPLRAQTREPENDLR